VEKAVQKYGGMDGAADLLLQSSTGFSFIVILTDTETALQR
jgi:hypothetical protein